MMSLQKHFCNMEIEDDPTCEHYLDDIEDLEHYLTDCLAFLQSDNKPKELRSSNAKTWENINIKNMLKYVKRTLDLIAMVGKSGPKS